MLFNRKNYDEQINKLIELNNNVIKSINDLHKLFDSMQENITTMVKVQSQHKAIITFLVNHATVDADAEEDLHKMMQDIVKVEKDIKKINKEGG